MFSAIISRSSSVISSAAAASALSASSSLRTSSPLLAASASRAYHAKVIDHYENPRNVGSMSKQDPNVGTGIVGAPACGDVMKLQILVDEATGEITEPSPHPSLVTEKIKGMTVWDAAKVKNTDIAKELSLPPVKLHCSMLAEDAIKSAIKDWEKKKISRASATNPAASASASASEVTL
ncbi:NifU-like N terminal domain-containing protein [Chytridium lagenaria]|nr:NifU-like N terminal domain-containing protein [Chytridium lagenaria]